MGSVRISQHSGWAPFIAGNPIVKILCAITQLILCRLISFAAGEVVWAYLMVGGYRSVAVIGQWPRSIFQFGDNGEDPLMHLPIYGQLRGDIGQSFRHFSNFTCLIALYAVCEVND
jgi:hypothetical protein